MIAQAQIERKIGYFSYPLVPFFRGSVKKIKMLFDFLETCFPDTCVRYSNGEISQMTKIVLFENPNDAELIKNEPKVNLEGVPIFFAESAKPDISYNDHAIWRRIRVINLSESASDFVSIAMSSEERLFLLFRLYVDIRARGDLSIPQAVIDNTEKLRQECFNYSDFVSECCVVDPDVSVNANYLYQAYKLWARCNNIKKFDTRTMFLMIMKERYSQQGNQFQGIALDAPEELL
ncbi:Hypothetical protein HVR_LOCUS601 [uncultured virus]|nr:Hypothetical protein HVR_LOCUS601 [uncultured virus]